MDFSSIDKATVERLRTVKAIAFDFGGTLDIPGIHWYDFLWSILSERLPDQEKITELVYYDAFVYAERRMEIEGIPENMNLLDTLKTKFSYQFEYLNASTITDIPEIGIKKISEAFANKVFEIVEMNLSYSGITLQELSCKYKIYIVSNYYGNLKTILEQAGLLPYITKVFDSTIVGIRKPDPAIWQKALDESGCKPEEFLIVGDSMKNDILPAQTLGCPAILISKKPVVYTGIHLTELDMLEPILLD